MSETISQPAIDQKDHNVTGRGQQPTRWHYALGYADSASSTASWFPAEQHGQPLGDDLARGGRVMVATRRRRLRCPVGTACLYVVTDHPADVCAQAEGTGRQVHSMARRHRLRLDRILRARRRRQLLEFWNLRRLAGSSTSDPSGSDPSPLTAGSYRESHCVHARCSTARILAWFETLLGVVSVSSSLRQVGLSSGRLVRQPDFVIIDVSGLEVAGACSGLVSSAPV